MNVEGSRNKTLLVQGPAMLTLLSGRSSILGAPLSMGQKLKVRKWRALPVYCEENSSFEVNLGDKASLVELEGNSIPEGWQKTVQIILGEAGSRNLVVTIIGGTDVGKTTFTVFLVNKALGSTPPLTTNIIDADIGQSDVGPPATVGTCSPTHFVSDLFYEKPDKVVFMGATSPAGVQDKMIGTITSLCDEGRRKFNLTALNTDGWVEGEDAHDYKLKIAQQGKVDLVVAISSDAEIGELVKKIREKGFETLEVKASPVTRKRSREERRDLRLQAYQRYLQNPACRVIPLSQVKVSGLNPWKPDVLLGLYNDIEEFLGLGVLKETDLERGVLRVFTSVRQHVHRIEVGQAVIDMPL